MTNKQTTVWNQTVGDAWVEHAEHFDKTLEQFGEAVMERLNIANRRVVDIGCGTGATTVRLASLAHPSLVTGIDLSVPMLAAARRRAAAAGVSNISFIESDVEAAPIGTKLFDVAYSRFGVMFFNDPVRAFVHIRESLVDGGQLGFVCFQSPAQNPFIVAPTMAAAQHLHLPPPAGPTAPSPFAFADRDRTMALLAEAGFVNVEIEAGPTEAILADNIEDLTPLARRLLEQNPGIAGALAHASQTDQDAAIAAATHALEPHLVDGRIVMGAATWLVTARAAGTS